VVDFEPSRVVEKGVLGPGNMMLVDTVNGRILRNEEVKKHYAAQFPYEKWLENNLLHIDDLTEKAQLDEISEEDRQTMHKLFGYTEEVIRTVIVPMAENGQEPVIAMGYDSPLAVLSQKINLSLLTSNNSLPKLLIHRLMRFVKKSLSEQKSIWVVMVICVWIMMRTV
jgi:glutamate synthase (NADPH/NADH) large chain